MQRPTPAASVASELSSPPAESRTEAKRPRNLAWLQGCLFSLAEGIVAGACVHFLGAQDAPAASLFVAAVVFCLRVQARVQRQIQPGDTMLFEKLVESLPGMVYQCRLFPTGRCVITYANSAIEWIYEKKLDDMRKDCSSILDLVHPDDRRRVWDSLIESALHLTPWKGEYRVILPRQGLRWRFAHAKVERLSDGGTLWHGFIADVTSRKEIEERIREVGDREAVALREAKDSAERTDRLKTEFLTMMSHEIRTPLNGVLGFAELLKGSELNSDQSQYVEMITASGERLLAMVNDTLDLAKINTGNLTMRREMFSLSECLDRSFGLLRPMADKKGLQYELHIAPGTPECLIGDSMRLSQVLTNLLGNAIKFTAQGRVDLQVSAQPAEPPHEGNMQWQFVVTDTGMGMTPEILAKLFELFYQGDRSTSRLHEGSGLGLAISRRLARLLGGDILVESRPGAGSEFTLTILAPRESFQPA